MKFPQILCYQEWFDLFSKEADKFYDSKQDVFKSKVLETPQMKELRGEILDSLENSKKIIEEIEAKMVKYQQAFTLEYPPVYLAMLKDSRPGSDSHYLTAKTFWPQIGGKKKEIRIYMGTEEKYKNYKKSPLVKLEARNKIIEALKDRFEKGEM
ncbi:hypothetical protein [Cloacibacterium normanense]|uniref:hypothetical protein n=1 Tax=Cloacibacterium normanense TaxID=237258 RepID=UPI0035B3A5D2